MLSYRHVYHAGNHADVLKHAVFVAALDHLNRKDKAWWMIDTHAGAGCYALGEGPAREHPEFREGVERLWEVEELPPLLARYREQIRLFNPEGGLQSYPGSPALARTLMRGDDRLRLFELHPADHALLAGLFAEDPRIRVAQQDGFAALPGLLPPPSRRGLILIDPPYELKQDYKQVARVLAEAYRRFAGGCYVVWYPLLVRSDVRQLSEALVKMAPDAWLDVRLMVKKPPRNGLGMYGSGVFVINPPWTLPGALEAAMPVLVERLAQDDTAHFELRQTLP